MSKSEKFMIIICILAGSVYLAMAAASNEGGPSLAPFLSRPTTAQKAPDPNGFIQRWIILEPIPASGLTDSAVQAAVKRNTSRTSLL